MSKLPHQKITVFQQNSSGESKIVGIRRHGSHLINLECIAIDQPLPAVLDDTGGLIPARLETDLVLDYLRHPDLSEDLAVLCKRQSIPLIWTFPRIRSRYPC